ncbi:hypothetical protein CAP35_14095 [Chitinophagaceae bacterium IBVUCB1]|nr:hypothetical protein CAP35_14095 [Chitinophagaceae bacterium IBVUCB1]
MCCIHTQVQAKWEPGYVLSGEVKEAKEKGTQFQSFNLFTATTGDKHAVLNAETLLLPNTSQISKLYNAYPKAVSLVLQTADGKEFVLDMLQSSPLAANPNMGYIDANGHHQATYEKAAHYQGSIRGTDRSIAVASIFANGDIMIMFSNADGNYVLGKLEDNSGRYILYNDSDFNVKPQNQCGVDDYEVYDKGEENTGNKTTAAYECKKMSVYWEADFQLYTQKASSVTVTQNYLIGLFNNVQALYRNEQIAIELKSVYVWATADGYDNTSSSAALSDFRATWNAKSNGFDGDVAMLVALDNGGQGGIAYLDILCNRNNAYAYGDINGTYASVPTYSWDVSMITHEHGHNMGSRHTHWCGWMTGAGGTCGSIDDCATKESSPGCSNCAFESFLNNQPVTAWRGTIMSYCHLVSRGISLANGFGPQPGDKIRAEIAAASCLNSIISATLTPTPICRNDGAITVAFNSNPVGSSNFGAAPFKYKWSNGATSQNLSGISSTGIYSVEITDSNGCINTYNATVARDTRPECWPTSVGSIVSDAQYISVYPNPANSQVGIKFFANTTDNVGVRVTDMIGKTTYTQQLQTRSGENDMQINISGWAKGIYFITLQSASQRFETVKLIVE